MPETNDQGTDQSLEQRFAAYFNPKPESAPEKTPEPTQAAPESAQPEEAAPEEPAEQPETDSEGLVEFDLNGKSLRVDPETAKELASLKEANLRQSDYTKKTQDLADLRRQATIIADQQKLANEFAKATEKEQEELQDMKSTLKLYKKLDWANMPREVYDKNKDEMTELKDRIAEADKSLAEKKQQFSFAAAQKRAELARSAYDFVSKHVKGFAPDSEVEKQVATYVDSTGLPVDAFVSGVLAYPSVAIMAYKAMQFDKLQEGKKQAVQAIKKAPPVVKPGATGNASTDKRAQELRGQFKKSGDFRDGARYLQTLLRKG